MKQFFKFMFASMTGFLLVIIILFFIMMGIVMSLASFSKKEIVLVPTNTVLHLSFSGAIPDRASKNPFENLSSFSLKTDKTAGLDQIIESLKKANYIKINRLTPENDS